MKNIFQIMDKIKISIFTIIFFVLASLCGMIKPLFLYFLIATIHELFHLFACKSLKVSIKKVTILPFGLSMEINEITNIQSLKQIFIYIAGPFSIIFNLIWIYIISKYEFIGQTNLNFLRQINFYMCLVNLLPIYPLDGYNILKNFLNYLFPYKKTLLSSIIISLTTFLFIVIFNFYSFQPLITFFLLFEQIRNIAHYKEDYLEFLIYKTENKKEKKYKIIQNYLLYKDINNYKIEKNTVLSDKEIAIIEIKKQKNKKKE